MKYLTIIMLLFSTPIFAMNTIEQKLQASPEMSATCTRKLAKLQSLVSRYESIPKNKRSVVTKLKLSHFKAELQNWKDYCTDPNNSVGN